NEPVLACENDWESALSFLQAGFFKQFFSGMGRFDLAMAADQAVRSPDPPFALDELLNRIPNNVRKPARLRVQPGTLNLGQVSWGVCRRLTIRLENTGMG